MTRERGGFGLLSELGYAPVNQYLPPRAVPADAMRPRRPRHRAKTRSASALARLIARARAALAS